MASQSASENMVQSKSEPVQKSRLDFRRIKELAYPERVRLSLGTLALFIGSGINLSVPALVGKLIDGLNKGNSSLNSITVMLVILFAISGIAMAFRSYLFTAAGERVVARLETVAVRSSSHVSEQSRVYVSPVGYVYKGS